MFRKLISNLPFSPTLIHDVGFYATRLRKEEATRRMTVFFVVLALIMQSLAVFSPPESANASSEQDIIRGGVSNLDDFLLRYDRNEDDVKDILTAVGITRTEIAALQQGSIRPSENTYILTRYGQISASTDEASLSYEKSTGGTGIRYFTPLRQMSSNNLGFSGWTGTSASIGWFAIMKSNGSLATQGLPSSVNPEASSTIKTISAHNLTQSQAIATATAQPLDKIAYTVKVTNGSQTTTTASFDINLSDTLEYAGLIDGGGGTLYAATGSLSWPNVQLAAGASQERTFVIQIFAELPATATGTSNPSSYDCILTAVFGTRLQIPVACPPVKGAESIFGGLPATGIMANVIFAVVLIMTVGYFYARTRQLKNEIRIIRHNLNAGIM